MSIASVSRRAGPRRAPAERSWKAVFARYWRLIYATARRFGLDAPAAEALVHEVVAELHTEPASATRRDPRPDPCRALRDVVLPKLAARRACEVLALASDAPAPETESVAGHTARLADLAAAWDRDWHRNLVQLALARVRDESPPRAFEAFRLTVLESWPEAAAAEYMKATENWVRLAKSRALQRIAYWLERESKQHE